MIRAMCLMVLAAVLAGAGLPAGAGPPPFADFTFKRVTPPKPGDKRITVQIAPPAPDAAPAAPDAPAAAEAPRHAWFWRAIDAGGGPAVARLDLALRKLANPPAGAQVPAPALAQLLDIAARHGPAMMRHTVGTGVSPALVLAVAAVESGGRTDAVSAKGARGLMQLMPDTARRYDVADATDAGENLRGAIAHLDSLLADFDGDPILALAAYNAGAGAVQRHGGVPPYAETRDYVPRVLAAYSVARALCQTPPQLISDGCVFDTGAR